MLTRVRFVATILLSFTSRGFGQTFFDDFNRPDNTVVGNGWSDLGGNLNGNLTIVNNELRVPFPAGYAGIYRSFSFADSTAISVTFKESEGFGGLRRRYNNAIAIRNDSTLNSGYGIRVVRSDSNFNNSQIQLFDGNLDSSPTIASFPASFQFGERVQVRALFQPNGSVTGNVSGDGNVFRFGFGPRTINSNGGNAAVGLEFPNPGAAVFARGDDYAIRSVKLVVPQAPVQLPSPVIPPAGTNRRLILVTHGWLGTGLLQQDAGWLTPLVSQLTSRASGWDVRSVNWEEFAATPGPTPAVNRAKRLGFDLGGAIVNAGYTDVQLIGHSAGSWLMDAAADRIASIAPQLNVQCTFLDAFVPLEALVTSPAVTQLGDTADFAEHYVDKNPSLVPFYGATNLDLDRAFNVDVTDVRPTPAQNAVAAHRWPCDWYTQTVANPASGQGYGFNLAPAFSGTIASHLTFPRGGRVTLLPSLQDHSVDVTDLNFETAVDLFAIQHAQSATGSVERGSASSIQLSTLNADEVWINGIVETAGLTNLLRLEANFIGDGGILSVLVDDNLMIETPLNATTIEFADFGTTLEPGFHSLAIRLDASNNSILQISSIQFGFIPEPTYLLLMPLGVGLMRRHHASASRRNPSR